MPNTRLEKVIYSSKNLLYSNKWRNFVYQKVQYFYQKTKFSINSNMRRQHAKRFYSSPRSVPTEVAFEQALLVKTARLLLEVDELENVNATTPGSDEPGGAMYLEF